VKKTNTSDRRKFLKATGGAILAVGSAGALTASGQHHQKVSFNSVANDPLGSATVSFGGWMTDFTPPLDRFTSPLPPPPSNHHVVTPNVAKIKAGGFVNFIISGLHIIAVYDDGTKPTDINVGSLVGLGTGLPPVINDATHRIYRGPNPVLAVGPPPVINLDRVEVVHFAEPGTYLVICAVLPHFALGMYSYVRVLPGGDSEVAAGQK